MNAEERPIKKHYQQFLAMDENDTVKNQFGWLPVSVYRPDKGRDWDAYFHDEGDPVGTRRSTEAKYLPGLRFSRFNPRTAEMIIRYWSLPGSIIVDPFSGRSTRAVVAAVLGRQYQGYEIVPVVAQQTQANLKKNNLAGDIITGDGCDLALTQKETVDLVFTCPPYHNIEKYESIIGQLSDISDYVLFLSQIQKCAENINRVLKRGGFVAWVCADWRAGGTLILFHKDSIDLFQKAGLKIHDIVILENISPFAPLQAGKVAAKRYTSKIHEYLIIFRKVEAAP